MTYISWSRDFALYLENCLMYEHHSLGLWASMTQHLTIKNKCKSLWPIFHDPVILPYILKTIWYMNTILWDYESVRPNVWPQNICRTLWSVFHGPLILLIFWKLFSGWTKYCLIMSQYDPISDLKIFVGHSDLYFMVHWICLISWRLFDEWTSYFGIIFFAFLT